MATLTRSITINAPVETVFGFVKDLGKLWVAWPGVAVREVELKPDGVGSSGLFYSHFLGLHFEGRVEFTEVVPEKRILAEVSSGGEHPTWEFTFEPVEGGTELTVQGEWHMNVPGVGKPVEGLMVKGHERGLESWLANIKSQVEAETAA